MDNHFFAVKNLVQMQEIIVITETKTTQMNKIKTKKIEQKMTSQKFLKVNEYLHRIPFARVAFSTD